MSWIVVPWSDLTLLIAIAVAAAAPTMLVASADLWRTAAQDGIAATTSGQANLALNGIDIAIEADFSVEPVRAAHDDVVSAVNRIAFLSAPDRSVYTLPGVISIGSPPLRTVGPQVVLFADARALESVDIVDLGTDADEGVWVTTWFAERHGLEVGDLVAFGNEAIGDAQWDGRS